MDKAPKVTPVKLKERASKLRLLEKIDEIISILNIHTDNEEEMWGKLGAVTGTVEGIQKGFARAREIVEKQRLGGKKGGVPPFSHEKEAKVAKFPAKAVKRP